MRRKDAWRRHQLLKKIEAENDKAHALLVQRNALQEARRQVRVLRKSR